MKVRVAFKGYFRNLKYRDFEYTDYGDFISQVGKIVGNSDVTRLEMLYLPSDVFVLLDSSAHRKPNAIGLRSNLIFVREDEDGNNLVDLEKEDFEIIKVLVEDEAFQEFYTLKGIDYYDVLQERMNKINKEGDSFNE